MIRIDPDANAALASAVASAKRTTKPSVTEPAEPEPAAALRKDRRSALSHVSRAAAVVALVGSCWLAAYAGTQAHRNAIEQAGVGAAASQNALARIGGEIEALRGEMAVLKELAAAPKADTAGQAELAGKVDALAAAMRSPDVRTSALEARLERMESQIMATLASLAAKPAAAAPAPAAAEASVRDPATTSAIKPAKSEPAKDDPARNEPVDGWVLREVYDGAALVEGRNRRLYEVAPGGIVPGVGRVEAIERRGKRWVVLTEKGIIGTDR